MPALVFSVFVGLHQELQQVVEVVVRGDGRQVPLQLGQDQQLHSLEEKSKDDLSITKQGSSKTSGVCAINLNFKAAFYIDILSYWAQDRC